ncbi:hypothetical protein GGS23DRAFT_599957 [Durotheca rogersii]|uniref:uncharacterized protein n=1 Tax=Durotheca rogersii TaxID=419775 RepID=UPI00221F4145|nr:uncharacterized protein GGS23DRAFT_599957 [Durotheca rogersii]KAI5860031.1 hypothetical protein GGS23DRAFT_599957 [Durotheca rogersii]
MSRLEFNLAIAAAVGRPRIADVSQASSRSSRAPRAPQVCATCKARKKKCDKVLPCCGYCVRKSLGCSYEPRPRAPLSLVSSRAISADPAAEEPSLYFQVHRLIRETGQFVDDISARYFQGFHHHVPVVSRARFLRNLTLVAVPPAPFSVLLLSICLVTPRARRERRAADVACAQSLDPRPLYPAAKSLSAQVQGLLPPAVPLVQAGLLQALYEYTHDRPDEAFASIAGCARMAYTLRMHPSDGGIWPQAPGSPISSPATGENEERDHYLQTQEAVNTWWALVIYERAFFCDVTVPEQPLVTVIPSGDAPLPREPTDAEGPDSAPRVPVSRLEAPDVGSFGRSAQAAWLLDQALAAFRDPAVESQLARLRGLDTTIQAFLWTLLRQCGATRDRLCEAVALTLRVLFLLHQHILTRHCASLPPAPPEPDPAPWSLAALDAAAHMTLDVVVAHATDPALAPRASTAPSYPYLVRAALAHVRTRKDADAWARTAEGKLCEALDRFEDT